MQKSDTILREGVVFVDIFKNKRVAVMTALEEDIAEHFYPEHMFVLADSLYKVSDHAILR